MSSHPSSNTPSASAKPPPPPASTGVVEPVPATLATPLGVVPPKLLSSSHSAPVVIPSTPNASVPALNSVPAMPASSTINQRRTADGSQSTANVQPGAGPAMPSPAPLKLMLERLHQHGIDCVEIVRRAAESAGASTDLLQKPSPGMGGGTTPVIPLFAPNQPLEIWTQSLKVSRTQGEGIVKHIWSIGREKMREAGLDMPGGAAARVGSTGEGDKTSSSGASTPIINTVPLGTGGDSTIYPNGTPTGQPALPAQPYHADSRASAPAIGMPPQPLPTSTYQPAAPRQRPLQASFHAPPMQPYGQPTPMEAYKPSLAQRHPYPAAQQPQPHLAQHSYQSHPLYHRPEMQAYVPPSLDSRTQVQPPAPKPVKATHSVPRPAKGGGTPALDFLRSLGVTDLGAPLKESSDTGSETSKGKWKGKGKAKAKDVVEGPIPVVQPTVVQPEVCLDKGTTNLQQTSEPTTVTVAPPVVNGSHTPSTSTLEPQQPSRPVTPPSPLLAPTIAVLQQSRSPSTTASPLPGPLLEIVPVLEFEPAPEPLLEQAPQPVAAPTLVAVQAPALAQPSAPVLVSAPLEVSALVEAPAPAEGSAAFDIQTADLVPADTPATQAPSAPTPPAALMLMTPPAETPPAIPELAPARRASSSAIASTSQLPLAEYAPLKRKRDSAGASVADPVIAPNSASVQESWAVQYARAANALNESKKARKAKFGDTPAQSMSASTSNAASGSRAPAKPKPRPLFNRGTPTSDEDVDVEEDQEEASPPKRGSAPQQQKGKRRMIMEVVLPLRKRAKPKAAAGV
jgi:hypothetical protein